MVIKVGVLFSLVVVVLLMLVGCSTGEVSDEEAFEADTAKKSAISGQAVKSSCYEKSVDFCDQKGDAVVVSYKIKGEQIKRTLAESCFKGSAKVYKCSDDVTVVTCENKCTSGCDENSCQVQKQKVKKKVSKKVLTKKQSKKVIPQDASLPIDEPGEIGLSGFSNSVDHAREDDITFQQTGPRGPSPIGPQGDEGDVNVEQECTIASVLDLQGNALLDYLKVRDYECLRFLWSFKEDSRTLFSSDNMITVFTEIERLASLYEGNNDDGMLPLMLFVRVGNYHKYYHPDEIVFTHQVKESLFSAFDTFVENENIHAFNEEAAQILGLWVQIVGRADAHRYVSTYKDILETFLNEPDRADFYQQRSKVYSVMFRISTSMGIYDSFGRQYYQNDAFMGAIDEELVEILGRFALNQDLADNDDTEYLVNNALWRLGHISTLERHHDGAIDIITSSLDMYPRLSSRYLDSVWVVDYYNDCQTAREDERICRADFQAELEEQLFPNTHVFDDGSIIVRTPLSLEQLQPLYHAVKEVQAQFNRISETIIPIHNDPNGVLTMVVYGTRSDYEDYQTFLYGLGTSNGGIYIEQDGTFYTYERTPRESIYTLEELLRHEYSHYIVGRYLIDGFWGQVPIYDNHRMTWFNEGFAEFLAWSSPETVHARRTLVQRIQRDGNERMSIDEITSATYGDFTFYRYAGSFFHFLYTHDIKTLRKLMQLAHTSDVDGFDLLIRQMRSDQAMNRLFQSHLDDLIENVHELTDPSTEFPDVNALDTDDPLQIQEVMRTTRLAHTADCSLAATNVNSRFSCRGRLSGSLRDEADFTAAWSEYDANLNEIRAESLDTDLNNFQAMLCRTGPIKFLDRQDSDQVYPVADYFCEGPLDQANLEVVDHVERVTGDFQSTRLGARAVCYRPEDSPREHTVSLTEESLVSSVTIRINTGDTVIWRNDHAQNILKVRRPEALGEAENFASGNLAPGQDFSHIFRNTGRFQYDYRVNGIPGAGYVIVAEPIDYENQVRCDVTFSTIARRKSIDQDVFNTDLQNDLISLQNQVYASNPNFYREFSCEFDAPSRTVERGEDQIYLTRNVQCTIS